MNLIKRWLILTGIIYLASLIAKNVTFSHGLSTVAILAVIIIIAQGLAKILEKTVFLPFSKLTLGLFDFILNIIIINLAAFLFNQVQFTPFDSNILSLQRLPHIFLAGFWSLLPFSAIIGTANRLLNRQE
jgi:uncharacterized membrane protein YvlD (DUF360 family)